MIDCLNLDRKEVKWSHRTRTATGAKRTLHLDGRIRVNRIHDPDRQERVRDWIERAADDIGVARAVRTILTGVVFEVRQGYKSKDSKRQQADIANAAAAYANAYLPCVSLFSNQIDKDIRNRYHHEKWAILTGTTGTNDDLSSLYDFMNGVVGHDLAGFFERNSTALKSEIDRVLRSLLEANNP